MLGASEANERAALAALRAYPGGLQLGGGVTAENAARYLEAGASHVIVTSYVFREGRLDERRLAGLVSFVLDRRPLCQAATRCTGSGCWGGERCMISPHARCGPFSTLAIPTRLAAGR